MHASPGQLQIYWCPTSRTSPCTCLLGTADYFLIHACHLAHNALNSNLKNMWVCYDTHLWNCQWTSVLSVIHFCNDLYYLRAAGFPLWYVKGVFNAVQMWRQGKPPTRILSFVIVPQGNDQSAASANTEQLRCNTQK